MREVRASRAVNIVAGCALSLALAGCAVESADSAKVVGVSATANQTQPGGATRTGAQTSGMAAQYAGPRPGAVAGAGASAWVPPAPPPAFVVTDLPPATPPAPPPAAVANRQPAPPPSPAVDASQIVRPEAAAPDAPAAPPAPSAATRQQARQLFANYSCGACHTFADAGAAGAIGPSLDNPTLTADYVTDVVKSGRGAMPSFSGQMSDEEIATLAAYIVGARR